MGQNGSKAPKELPKRGSVHSASVPVENVRRTLFDHVIELLLDNSARFVPQSDAPEQPPLAKIHETAFVETLFTLPEEVDGEHHLQRLGRNWFRKAAVNGSKSGEWLDRNSLLKACERYHGIIDDHLALSTYLSLYADQPSSGKQLMPKDNVQAFLELSLFLYLLDSWNSEEKKEPDKGQAQVQALLDGLFNDVDGREPKEARSVLKYFETNFPNCVQHVHKFVLFRLVKGSVIGGIFTNRVVMEVGDVDSTSFRQLLNPFKMWQLSSVLPVTPYFKAPVDKSQQAPAPITRRPSYYLTAPFGSDASSQSITVATWQLLYNSDAHGVGTNRFSHHVLGYRGPTILLALCTDPKNDGQLFEFVLAQNAEWREACAAAFADKMACAAELRHHLKCLGSQKATPWIYYNMGTQRGQKKGLHLGEPGEPPVLSLDDSYDNAAYEKRALHVLRIEVWGCGTQADRARQLDVKKWQVREAEKQRVVKLSADDWLDHPDRYLLEMSGRQSYVTQKEKEKK